MRKLITSILAIAVLGGVVALGSQAFFSDTETSTGNVLSAGAIDLKIDSQCTYNGQASSECGTWDPKDLTSEKFFNFVDLKPGDQGENTISMDLSSNPANACVIIENMHDDDNGLTEPEFEDGDTTNGPDQGELASLLHFFTWADDGDNVWESGEQPLFSNVEGPASDVLDGKSYNLGVIQPGSSYIGVYWCYGDLTVGVNTLSCDGSTADNTTQTDRLSADIRFYVEQTRNNTDFQCPNPEKRQRTIVVNGQNLSPNFWFGYNDETNTIDNSLVSFVAGPATAPSGNGSAQMTVSGTQRRNIATRIFSGLPLANIDALSFSTYWPSGQPGSNRDIYLHFNVDFNGTDTWQRRLVFVPADNGVITQDTWQSWNAFGPTALWQWSGFVANGNKWPDNNTNALRSWSDILTAFPTLRMRIVDSWFGFRAGEPYADGFTGNVDSFVIGINGSQTTYDFEQ